MTTDVKVWVQKGTECQFPVLTATKRGLLRLLDNEENIKVDDLASLAHLDPGFAISLLREAGVRSRNKREITTLAHAILLLSIPQTIKLLHRSPELEKTIEPDLAHKIKRLYFYQHLTGRMARDWSLLRKESETREVLAAALNHDFVHLFLYLAATPIASELYNYRTTRLSELRQKETELLGCSVDELSTTLASEWNLPFLIRESFTDNHHNPKIQGIRLADELVQWMYIHKTFDYPEKLHQRVTAYMRLPADKSYRLINKTVVNVFRETHQKLPVGCVIRAFMSHPARIFEQTKPQPESRKDILVNCLQQLREQPDNVSSIVPIKLVIDALHKALGLSRSAFLFFDADTNCLCNAVTAYDEESKQLKKVAISLELNKLFRKVMEKETLFVIHEKNQHKYLPHMPPGLRADGNNSAMLIHSISIAEDMRGCFIINHAVGTNIFSERELKAYKKVCNELKAALTLIEEKRKAKVA